MARISGFLPRLGPLIGRPSHTSPAPGPLAGAAPVAPPPVFDPIPEQRPDMSGIERPTLDEVLSQALTPDFLGTEQLTPGEFMACLRNGAALLGELDGDDASRAAETIGEALEDKEMLESCRLLLVKG